MLLRGKTARLWGGYLVAVALLALAAVVLVGRLDLPVGGGSSGSTVARVGERAPEIALPALGGGTRRLAEQRGTVVLLNFWATWCIPCREEMPELQRLSEELAGQPFALWAVNYQEDAASVEGYLGELHLRLPVLLDENGAAGRAFGVRALPATFLVGPDGRLRQTRLGPIVGGDDGTPWSRAWLVEQVRSLLAR